MFFVRFIISNLFSIVLIGMILLLKKLLKNKVSLKFHYHIWFTLLLSLMVVFVPTSFLRSIEFSNITQAITAPSDAPSENMITAPDTPKDWRYDFTEMADTSDSVVFHTVLTMCWAVGILGTIGLYYLGSRKLKNIKRFTELPPGEIAVIFHDCCKRASIKHKICLLQSDMITSPLSFGCRIPYIVIPSTIIQKSSPMEIEHILLHELMHIKHKDIWVNFWLCAEQSIYWFNPFIWWAFSEMRRDREAYCDWSVLNIYSTDEERLCYGDTLLQFAGQKNHTLVYTANRLFDHTKQIKYRIERIADFHKETAIVNVIGRCLIAAFFLVVMLQAPVFAAFASDFGLSYRSKQSINILEQDYTDLYGDASGCAVVYDIQSNVYRVYRPSEIMKRIAPCSTCKIYSAINALEQGIITPNRNTLEWDHLARDIPAWNGNQNLSSALKNSVNWYFQFLDQTAGAEELERFYRHIGYGNGYVGSDTAYYWNGSALKISPLEQVELLVKFYHNDFGFNEDNVRAVQDAIFLSESQGIKLYGKTGTGRIGDHDVHGWFIGYIETGDNTYFFAVTIQNEKNANGNAAVQIAYSIFERMGIKIDL